MKNVSETITIRKPKKGKLPRLPFLDIKEKVLGKKYELSIVFASKKLAQELNIRYRGKDYVPNVLSFPLSKTSGEMVINLETVKREAPQFGKSYEKFLGFIFIHGLLHLKGMAHGSIMEKQEVRLSKKFNF
ncbi:MAG: rRNA maturation RNase YbeY [Candidatus Paceibacterota bacterium]|jgi:probable rRNA maturation factor